jgi:hypothetical protein
MNFSRRKFSHPPEKVWRALTEGALIEEWLMKNDFKPVVDHHFNLRADCGEVDCQVLAFGLPAPAYQGAKAGWQQFFAALERVVARID